MNYVKELKCIREQVFQVALHAALYNPELSELSGLRIKLDQIIFDLEKKRQEDETEN